MRNVAFVLLALLIAFGTGGPVAAQDTASSARTVTVTGEGTVAAEPDRATVRFGVVTQAETPEDARSKNAEAAKNAMNAVRELGVADENLRMEALRLQPRREYDRKTETYEEKGYEASRQVVVDLQDLELLPTLVARVVQKGANRLEGVNYELSNREELRNEAMRNAAQNARQKAQLLVESLEATLGPVREIREQDFSFRDPSPRMLEFAKAGQTDASPEPEAYAAGEIEVTTQVQVVFGIDSTE